MLTITKHENQTILISSLKRRKRNIVFVFFFEIFGFTIETIDGNAEFYCAVILFNEFIITISITISLCANCNKLNED